MLRLLKAFVNEVRRREVLRIVAVYAVVAWLILQVAEVTLEPLGFPDWTMRALIVAAIVGFPVAFFVAWIIKIEPEGLMFDLPLWRGISTEREHYKTDYVVVAAIATLLIIGAYSIGMRVFRDIPVEDPPAIAAAEVPPNSIAVLAFENLAGKEETNYFASGLAEEILIKLSELPELNVAARSSSFQFRGQNYDAREIAKKLGVRHVLDGGVRQAGNRIRASAQLIDGNNGYNVWSNSYDRTLEDIFAIQDEIASGVVNELKISLSLDSEKKLKERPTESLDAYVFYLQGIERLRSPPDRDVRAAAAELFNRALEIDPGFARAYAGVCEAKLSLYNTTNDTSHFDLAEQACGKAAELDPGLTSDVHTALATLYRHRGWLPRAEEEIRRALAIEPSSADGYIELARIRWAQDRRDDAETAFMRAIDLEIRYWRAHEALGDFYYRTERYDDAVKAFQIVASLAPENASAFADLGAARWMQGRSEEARAAWDRSLELKPTRQGFTNMGLRYYYAGQFDDAAAMQRKALEIAPRDHRLWGRLAESYRFIPGEEGAAREAYARAAELAEENLAINDTDWTTMGLLALYYAYQDQHQDAVDLASKAVRLSGNDPEILYYQALAELKAGNTDAAITALEAAVAADEGYRQFIETDPDLKRLADIDRFARLLHGG